MHALDLVQACTSSSQDTSGASSLVSYCVQLNYHGLVALFNIKIPLSEYTRMRPIQDYRINPLGCCSFSFFREVRKQSLAYGRVTVLCAVGERAGLWRYCATNALTRDYHFATGA